MREKDVGILFVHLIYRILGESCTTSNFLSEVSQEYGASPNKRFFLRRTIQIANSTRLIIVVIFNMYNNMRIKFFKHSKNSLIFKKEENKLNNQKKFMSHKLRVTTKTSKPLSDPV